MLDIQMIFPAVGVVTIPPSLFLLIDIAPDLSFKLDNSFHKAFYER
jgi:hypothetical protein